MQKEVIFRSRKLDVVVVVVVCVGVMTWAGGGRRRVKR